MRTMSVLKVLVVVVGLLLVAGCSQVRVRLDPDAEFPETLRIGVLDFEHRAGSAETLLGGAEIHRIEDGGVVVADAVAAALVSTPGHHVVARGRVKSVMEKMGLSPTDVVAPENLKPFGEAAGVDAVVVGCVTDFHWWQVALSSGSRLTFDVRAVETTTGRVLWSASCNRGKHVDHNTALHDTCEEMAAELADMMEDRLQKARQEMPKARQ